MLKQYWPFLATFGLAVVGAVGALVYAVSGGSQFAFAIEAAIGCAIVGQLMLFGLSLRQDERREGTLRRVARDAAGFHAEVRRKTDGFQSQIDALRQQGEAQSSAVIKGIGDLKESYGDLRATLEGHRANTPPPVAEPEFVEEIRPSFAPPPPAVDEVVHAISLFVPQPAPAPEPAYDSFADQISFSLEPVVDMLTRRTAHYRMHLAISFGGEELSNDRLLHYAGREGRRSMLDLLAAREAIELLGKLRQRDPELCLFVNIGADTLSNEEALLALMELRQSAAGLANGLILEMPHAMLAGLPDKALEGLARLARHGFSFALGQVSVNGLDLQSMNLLNVRHVELWAGAIEPDGPSTTLIGFAQMARLARITVIVTGVTNAQTVPKLQGIARLACGPCFATPRRVKRRQSASDPMVLAA